MGAMLLLLPRTPPKASRPWAAPTGISRQRHRGHGPLLREFPAKSIAAMGRSYGNFLPKASRPWAAPTTADARLLRGAQHDTVVS